MIRVAILGGTFDPPTVGHIAAAQAALELLAVDAVWLMPAGDPVDKPGATPAATRVEMCRVAVADEPRIDVCVVEAQRAGPTFTVDTLEDLAALPIEVVWLVGDDVDIDGWRDTARCKALAQFCRIPRMGWPPRHDQPRLDIAAGPAVSSTMVRDRLRTGVPVTDLVPAGVVGLLDVYRAATAA